MRRVYAHEELCMGCGLCEIYCAVHHSKSKDVIKAFKREHPNPISRIKLLENKPVSLAAFNLTALPEALRKQLFLGVLR